MARVVWTREAISNVELIRAYVQQFDPAAAPRMARRLIEAGDGPCDFQERGRPVPNGRRELPTLPAYIIRYRMEADHVFILPIRHGRQG
jgi:toxin ParE1/3/4